MSDETLCSVSDEGAVDDQSDNNSTSNPDGYLDLICDFVTQSLSDLNDLSETANLTIVGCNDPLDEDGCQPDDDGYFMTTGSDSVTIVKDCE